MTKRQRAQVVELLRCAADRWQFDGRYINALLCDTSDRIESASGVAWHAISVRNSILPYELRDAKGDLVDFEHVRLLEAAQRVEEGSWP